MKYTHLLLLLVLIHILDSLFAGFLNNTELKIFGRHRQPPREQTLQIFLILYCLKSL